MTVPTMNASLTKAFTRLKSGDLAQGILLSGEVGVGLKTIALWLATDHLHDVLEPTKTTKTIRPVISVDDIRRLYQNLTTKSARPRVVIIDDADLMTTAAQNAFLKLLEEPPTALHFIVTTHNESQLLSTVRSRLQTYKVPLLSSMESKNFIAKHTSDPSPEHTRQLLFIASGRPAELIRLMEDAQYFSIQTEQFRKARDFLSQTTYLKITDIARISDRDAAVTLIDTALTILRRSLVTRTDTTIIREMKRLLSAKEAIVRGGNVRLQLLKAVV